MLIEPLKRHAVDRPDDLAFADTNLQLTWRQAAGMAGGLGAMLRQATQADTVAVALPASAAFAVAWYGVLAAGKTVVPINFLLGPEAIGHVLKDSGADVVLTAPPLSANFENIPGIKAIDLTQLDAGAAAPLPEGSAGPDDLATLLYTSGTSGQPKGVRLTHGNLATDAAACIEHAALVASHKFLGVVPLFHSTGLLATLLAPAQLGAPTHYLPRFSPVAMLQMIREYGISVTAGVPSMYGALLRLKEAAASDFEAMYLPLSGGEPLPGRIAAGFEQRFGKPLMEGYGLTETCGPVAVNMPHQTRPGSVGRTIPGCEVKIDPDGQILLRGPMVFSGYHNLPADTAGAFTDDGYFRTGDLGHVDDDGYLHVTGRIKDLIIVGGENIHPRPIEEALTSCPAITQAAVVGKKDESRGEVPVAFVVLAEGQTLDEAAVKEHLRGKNVPQFALPRQIVAVEQLPMTPTGKVLKRELAATL
jgi:long-chain acyl-CoA synthetase